MAKVKYEVWPKIQEIEQAGYSQLVMWLNWLPVPQTQLEEALYNIIVDRRKELMDA